MAALARERENFRRLLEPVQGDIVFGLATFLESFDVRTAYPLLLLLLDAALDDEQWRSISTILESYLLRPAVLGWTTKAYNRIFLNLAKSLRAAAATPPGQRRKIALARRHKCDYICGRDAFRNPVRGSRAISFD